jgi:hypothetical protein
MPDGMKVQARSNSPLRCSLCHETIARKTGWVCGDCGTQAHVRCAEEMKRCPTLGCSGRVPIGLASSSTGTASIFWHRVQLALGLVLLVTVWIGAAFLLHSLQNSRPWVDPCPFWQSFLAVGVLLVPGGLVLWKLKRDGFA